MLRPMICKDHLYIYIWLKQCSKLKAQTLEETMRCLVLVFLCLALVGAASKKPGKPVPPRAGGSGIANPESADGSANEHSSSAPSTPSSVDRMVEDMMHGCECKSWCRRIHAICVRDGRDNASFCQQRNGASCSQRIPAICVHDGSDNASSWQSKSWLVQWQRNGASCSQRIPAICVHDGSDNASSCQQRNSASCSQRVCHCHSQPWPSSRVNGTRSTCSATLSLGESCGTFRWDPSAVGSEPTYWCCCCWNGTRQSHNNISRCFRYAGCIGSFWYATNGLLQGDPLSVVILNCVLCPLINRLSTMEDLSV